eukprot:458791-Hanusia_phi.AAC.1
MESRGEEGRRRRVKPSAWRVQRGISLHQENPIQVSVDLTAPSRSTPTRGSDMAEAAGLRAEVEHLKYEQQQQRREHERLVKDLQRRLEEERSVSQRQAEEHEQAMREKEEDILKLRRKLGSLEGDVEEAERNKHEALSSKQTSKERLQEISKAYKELAQSTMELKKERGRMQKELEHVTQLERGQRTQNVKLCKEFPSKMEEVRRRMKLGLKSLSSMLEKAKKERDEQIRTRVRALRGEGQRLRKMVRELLRASPRLEEMEDASMEEMRRLAEENKQLVALVGGNVHAARHGEVNLWGLYQQAKEEAEEVKRDQRAVKEGLHEELQWVKGKLAGVERDKEEQEKEMKRMAQRLQFRDEKLLQLTKELEAAKEEVEKLRLGRTAAGEGREEEEGKRSQGGAELGVVPSEGGRREEDKDAIIQQLQADKSLQAQVLQHLRKKCKELEQVLQDSRRLSKLSSSSSVLREEEAGRGQEEGAGEEEVQVFSRISAGLENFLQAAEDAFQVERRSSVRRRGSKDLALSSLSRSASDESSPPFLRSSSGRSDGGRRRSGERTIGEGKGEEGVGGRG